MSYTIYHADGLPVSVPDNTIDTEFYNVGQLIGTQLIGRNAINYGTAVAQNFLQQAENFASLSSKRPTDEYALQGQLWFEKSPGPDGTTTIGSTNGNLYVRKSSAAAGGAANWSKVVTEDGGLVPVINPTGAPKNGDIRVVGAVISIYAAGAWQQVFPAVYSA